MKAIIMAGGKGTRLAPLTDNLPKPMVKILDEPVINYTVKLLDYYGIEDIGVTLQYLPEKVMEGLTRAFPIKFRFFVEEQPLGTAGSVKNASSFLTNCDEPVLIISGDALTNINIPAMFDEHIKSGAPVTMAVQRSRTPWLYGVVVPDNNDNIIKFQEKPPAGEELTDLVNCGIYIINPEVLDLIPADTQYDFSKDLFMDMVSRKIPIHVYRNEEYWCDIGNIAAYHRANMDMLNGVKGLGLFTKGKNILADASCTVFVGDRADIDLRVRLFGGVVIGNDVKISGQAEIADSVLCDGAILEGGKTFEAVVTPEHRLSIAGVLPHAASEKGLQRQAVVN